MKRILVLMLLSLFSGILPAQQIEMSDSELNAKLDSVLVEATLLYKYEKASWVSTDLALENLYVKSFFHSYLTYEDDGKIITIIIGRDFQTCIAEYIYENDFDNPKSSKIENRPLSAKENELIEVRDNIIKNISKRKYGISVPHGFSLNFILLPFHDGYKFYIITGTSQHNVIPFGNDFIFYTNKTGKIKSWKKFHSGLIPAYTMYGDAKVTEMTHSHLRTTPLITATDICTFMLYAPLYEIDSFSVYSPALGKYMTYSLLENIITVK
jgi:hypothetical protein